MLDQVNGRTVDFNGELPHFDIDGFYNVKLELSPVGATVTPQSDAELRSLVSDVLSTLHALHVAGLVHRDVRLVNILSTDSIGGC